MEMARIKFKLSAEFLGSYLLLTAIVGSGIMATQLTDIVGIQLLINALSTILMLAVLIALFQSISGAHFNPIVTLLELQSKKIELKQATLYLVAQILGAIAGTITANLMFDLDLAEISTNNRFNSGTFIGEVLATFGLILVISLQPTKAAILVPAWIGSAYFFTSSTSFANPAVTIGRIFTDSFAGIAPSSVLPFIIAQLLGLFMVMLLKNFISKNRSIEGSK
jgi:glycerol uptake facilitator-like aquaporin